MVRLGSLLSLSGRGHHKFWVMPHSAADNAATKVTVVLQYIYNTSMPAPPVSKSKLRKTAAMTFRFTPEFREQLIAAAAHEKRSQANMLEWLVGQYCEREGIVAKKRRG